MGKRTETFDIQMSIILCKEHKKIFENEVKVYLPSGRLSIQPGKLTELWHNAESCTQCRWKTLFDGSD